MNCEKQGYGWLHLVRLISAQNGKSEGKEGETKEIKERQREKPETKTESRQQWHKARERKRDIRDKTKGRKEENTCNKTNESIFRHAKNRRYWRETNTGPAMKQAGNGKRQAERNCHINISDSRSRSTTCARRST
jgi:hypothetical protein